MSKIRTSALAAAGTLMLVHGAVLAFRYGTETASLWGDWIDTAAPLVAAVVCWMVSRQAGPFGRRVWRLVAFSSLLTAIGQGLYTDYYDYLHAPLGTLWPSDVLVFFWIVPAMMTLFLSPRDPGSGYGWLRVCDFAQVCVLALAVELSQIYVPSRWQVAGHSMQVRTLHAGIFFFGLVALSFLVRGRLSFNRTEKAFFLRLGGFLTVHGIVLNTTLYYYYCVISVELRKKDNWKVVEEEAGRWFVGAWQSTRDYVVRGGPGDPRGRNWGGILGTDKSSRPARAEGEKRFRSATRNP